MEFIETNVFSRMIGRFLSEEEFRQLQLALIIQPGIGQIIPGSGGLRKLRWFSQGKGKRGGLRVIYYWYNLDNQICLLYAYKKSHQKDLTNDQIKTLKKLLEED